MYALTKCKKSILRELSEHNPISGTRNIDFINNFYKQKIPILLGILETGYFKINIFLKKILFSSNICIL